MEKNFCPEPWRMCKKRYARSSRFSTEWLRCISTGPNRTVGKLMLSRRRSMDDDGGCSTDRFPKRQRTFFPTEGPLQSHVTTFARSGVLWGEPQSRRVRCHFMKLWTCALRYSLPKDPCICILNMLDVAPKLISDGYTNSSGVIEPTLTCPGLRNFLGG